MEKAQQVDIIDFDLIQQGERFPGSLSDREEVRKELEYLLQEYADISGMNSAVIAKLEACLTYLKAL